MGQYIESALFRVEDGASKPLSGIDRALQSVFKSANKLKGVSDPFKGWAQSANKATTAAQKLTAELRKFEKASQTKAALADKFSARAAQRDFANELHRREQAIIASHERAEKSRLAAMMRTDEHAARHQTVTSAKVADEIARASKPRKWASGIGLNMGGGVHAGIGTGGDSLLKSIGIGAIGALTMKVGHAVLHGTFEQAKERGQENYLQSQTLDGTTQAAFRAAAESISDKYSSVTVTEALRMLREGRDKVKSNADAAKIANVDAGLFQNMQRFNGGDEKQTMNDVSMMRKSAEMTGRIVDIHGNATPERYKEFLDAFMKVRAVEGSSFNAQKANQASIMLKSMGSTMTPEAFQTAYLLASEENGGRAGNGIYQMVRTLTGNAYAKNMAVQKELGLIGGSGAGKGFKYAGTKDEALLRTDPLAWIRKDILGSGGALEKFGKTKAGSKFSLTAPKELHDGATEAEKAAFDKQVQAYRIGVSKFVSTIGANASAVDTILKLTMQSEETENKLNSLKRVNLSEEANLNARKNNINSALGDIAARMQNAEGRISELFSPTAISGLNLFSDAVKGATGTLNSAAKMFGIITGPKTPEFPDHGQRKNGEGQSTDGEKTTWQKHGASILAGGGIAGIIATMLAAGKGGGGIMGKLLKGGGAIGGIEAIAEGTKDRLSNDPLIQAAGALKQSAGELSMAAAMMQGKGSLPGIAKTAGETVAETAGNAGKVGAVARTGLYGIAAAAVTYGVYKFIQQTAKDNGDEARRWKGGPSSRDLGLSWDNKPDRDRIMKMAKDNEEEFKHNPEVKRGHEMMKIDLESLQPVTEKIDNSVTAFGSVFDGVPQKGVSFGDNVLASMNGGASAWGAAAGDAFVAKASSVTVNVNQPKSTGAPAAVQ